MIRPVAGVLVLAVCVSALSVPAPAQRAVVRHPGVPYHHHHYRPPYHHHHSSDFNTAMAVIGTVGAVAAIANARHNSYYYNPYPAPYPVVVTPRPTVVVTQPNPVVVQRPVVVERQVIVERQTPVSVRQEGAYSPKLGAWFRIENMQLPGYNFTAARLVTDPMPHSPLFLAGLRKGDVITRLNDIPTDTLEELERHSGNTLMRYIKTGTTKVQLANIHIPAGTDTRNSVYNAP